jgi:hypothetical protein
VEAIGHLPGNPGVLPSMAETGGRVFSARELVLAARILILLFSSVVFLFAPYRGPVVLGSYVGEGVIVKQYRPDTRKTRRYFYPDMFFGIVFRSVDAKVIRVAVAAARDREYEQYQKEFQAGRHIRIKCIGSNYLSDCEDLVNVRTEDDEEILVRDEKKVSSWVMAESQKAREFNYGFCLIALVFIALEAMRTIIIKIWRKTNG